MPQQVHDALTRTSWTVVSGTCVSVLYVGAEASSSRCSVSTSTPLAGRVTESSSGSRK